jgi:hypothetical protein
MTTRPKRPVGSVRSPGETVFDFAPEHLKRLRGLMKSHLAEAQHATSAAAKGRKASAKRRRAAA